MTDIQEYAIVVERAESGGNWCGYSPDVPGVIATDSTAEATAERLRGALELHLKVMANEGMPLPVPSALVRMVKIAA